ncbi:MAG TPA: serine/threonine-protein kinase [Polyangiaceae bacterium]|nr:serine/threonine-protein kinase [Polyangiaceae bacterium]
MSPGDVLAGKYRVERVLGAGGMGVVVAALHLELEERVAVKFLLPEYADNENAAKRFLREARAAARIKSEYVARVIDVGRLETSAPYMVMEYLEGRDLSALVSGGPLPIDDAVDYVIQACHAMAEAHAAGIVHRDLKPANLFLAQRSDGTRVIKVLDFGISKGAAGGDLPEASLTKTSTMMGSPYYMSPEQMRSARDVDHRTDIWSLGVILFELISGRTPFQGDSLPGLLTSIMTDTPPSLTGLRPDVPLALEQIVLRCLRKSRDDRIQDVGALTRALLPFGSRRSRYTAERVLKLTGSLESLPASLPPEVELGETVAIGPAPAVGAQTATNWAETQGDKSAKHGKRKLVWGGAALAGVLGACFTVWAVKPSVDVARSPAVRTSPSVVAAAGEVPAAPPLSAPSAPEVLPIPPPQPQAAASSESGEAASNTPKPVVNVGADGQSAPKRKASQQSPSKVASPAHAPETHAEPAAAPAPAPKAKRNPLAIELK